MIRPRTSAALVASLLTLGACERAAEDADASQSVAAARFAVAFAFGSAELTDGARDLLARSGFGKIDYVSLVDPDTLQDLPDTPLPAGSVARLLGAAWIAIAFGPEKALAWGVGPFIATDVIKAALAAAVVPAGWQIANLFRR